MKNKMKNIKHNFPNVIDGEIITDGITDDGDSVIIRFESNVAIPEGKSDIDNPDDPDFTVEDIINWDHFQVFDDGREIGSEKDFDLELFSESIF